jgi:hypothetical protein
MSLHAQSTTAKNFASICDKKDIGGADLSDKKDIGGADLSAERFEK